MSADELVALEEARPALRRDHGIAVDRGRIVREAVAVVVADLEAKGEASIVVRRLREGLTPRRRSSRPLPCGADAAGCSASVRP